MRLFMLIALVLFIFMLITATGTVFITGWNVWLAAGLISCTLDWLTGGYSWNFGTNRTVVVKE